MHPIFLTIYILLYFLLLPPAHTSNTTLPTAPAASTKVAQQTQVHRYLVVSRERFLVLDASGGGVGSEAVVKSNRHLTEVS